MALLPSSPGWSADCLVAARTAPTRQPCRSSASAPPPCPLAIPAYLCEAGSIGPQDLWGWKLPHLTQFRHAAQLLGRMRGCEADCSLQPAQYMDGPLPLGQLIVLQGAGLSMEGPMMAMNKQSCR